MNSVDTIRGHFGNYRVLHPDLRQYIQGTVKDSQDSGHVSEQTGKRRT